MVFIMIVLFILVILLLSTKFQKKEKIQQKFPTTKDTKSSNQTKEESLPAKIHTLEKEKSIDPRTTNLIDYPMSKEKTYFERVLLKQKEIMDKKRKDKKRLIEDRKIRFHTEVHKIHRA